MGNGISKSEVFKNRHAAVMEHEYFMSVEISQESRLPSDFPAPIKIHMHKSSGNFQFLVLG